MSEEKNESILGNEVTESEVSAPNIIEDNSAPNVEIAAPGTDSNVSNSISTAPIIEGMTNTEGIMLKEKEGKKSDSSKISIPKLFIKEEDFTEIDVDVLFDAESGEIYSITQAGMIDTEELSVLVNQKYTFKFKQITYDDMQKYRRGASFFAPQSGEMVINRMTLRQLFLMNHLVDTDIPDEDGSKFEIEIDEETGIMNGDTASKLFSTAPALLDVVLTLFERSILIMFESNNQ
jgi:hypothetical protein